MDTDFIDQALYNLSLGVSGYRLTLRGSIIVEYEHRVKGLVLLRTPSNHNIHKLRILTDTGSLVLGVL